MTILQWVAKLDPSAFRTPDDLGWTPFHEAVRLGHLDCIKVMLHAGNDGGDSDRGLSLVNLRTYAGSTPLDLARTYLSEDHPVTQFLITSGGIDEYTESQDEL